MRIKVPCEGCNKIFNRGGLILTKVGSYDTEHIKNIKVILLLCHTCKLMKIETLKRRFGPIK